MQQDTAFRSAIEEKFTRLLKFKNLQPPQSKIVETVTPEKEKGGRWLRRRMAENEYLLGILAGEDQTIAGYNSNGGLYIKDEKKYDEIVGQFVEKNGVGPRRLRPGTIYYVPDLNGDGLITYGTPEKVKEQQLEKVPKINAAFSQGMTFRWYLAGELGREALVDEEGEFLPVRRGKLALYTQQFFDDNEGIQVLDKIQAGKLYWLRDYNGDGEITLQEPK